MSERFKVIYPESPLLRDLIYCFYVYESNNIDNLSIHYSLPHTFNAISIYQNAVIEPGEDLKATGTNDACVSYVLQGKRQAPLRVELQGCLKRVTIVFKPLGLNHFLTEPLGNIMRTHPVLFSYWNDDNALAMQEQLFDAGNFPQVSALEKFLEHAYQPRDFTMLGRALEYLAADTPYLTVAEVAARLGLPLRTFNRLFRLHLGVSPKTHQRISRFRDTLESKLLHDPTQNLTSLSYAHQLYDQSAFIKLYRQLAGTNPQKFLSDVRRLAESHLFFQFVS